LDTLLRSRSAGLWKSISLSPGHQLLATQEVSAWARGAQGTAEGILTPDCTSPAGLKRAFTATSVQERLVKSKISEEIKFPGWVPAVLHTLLHKGVEPRTEGRSGTAGEYTCCQHRLPAPLLLKLTCGKKTLANLSFI